MINTLRSNIDIVSPFCKRAILWERYVLLATMIWPIPSLIIHWLLRNTTFGEIPVTLTTIWSLPSVVPHMG